MAKQVRVDREVFGNGENLLLCGNVMRLPPEIKALEGRVQCVCVDPPFMTGEKFTRRSGWSYSIICPDDDFERCFRRRADKRRKLYNGMISCQLYQYFK